jgi:Lrp/AsnC family transcriptional regulator
MQSELDAYDRRILEVLQADASCPVRRSPSASAVAIACWRRIQRLKEEG